MIKGKWKSKYPNYQQLPKTIGNITTFVAGENLKVGDAIICYPNTTSVTVSDGTNSVTKVLKERRSTSEFSVSYNHETNSIKENTKMIKSHITFHYLNGSKFTARNIEKLDAYTLVSLDFTTGLRYTKYDKLRTAVTISLHDVTAIIYKEANVEFVVKNPNIHCASVKTEIKLIKELNAPKPREELTLRESIAKVDKLLISSESRKASKKVKAAKVMEPIKAPTYESAKKPIKKTTK